MKKTIYLLFMILFILPSCTNQDEIFDIEDEILNIELKRKKDKVTVVGENNPTTDLIAVQNAVDNNDWVILSGVFDFGLDEESGGVDITRPNMTLQGPASILNGGKYDNLPYLGGFTYPLGIRAPGVEVRDLEISGNHEGILIYVQEDGKPVVFQRNTVESNGVGVAATATKGGIKVVNNNLQAYFGYYAMATTGTTEISHNEIEAWLDGVRVFSFSHKLDIINNNMSSIGYTGIWIGAWSVSDETDPEWGNNKSVKIVGNTIDIDDFFAAGIMVGGSNFGINNVMVKDNTLTGLAGYGGLVKQPYGHNNKFINNDLTGLTTYSPQIWVMGGRDNHYQNNKLGEVKPFSVAEWGWGPAFRDAATLVSPVNWHLNDELNTPDPINYNNHFNNNDYRLTGALGWSDDPEESFGAVLLLDFLQKYDEFGNPFEEPFIMENYIAEKKFPAGTDVCTQVLDLSNLQGDDLVQGNNHIAGWTACEAHANKAIYQIMKNRYKNKGQSLKNRNKKREKAMFERRN